MPALTRNGGWGNVVVPREDLSRFTWEYVDRAYRSGSPILICSKLLRLQWMVINAVSPAGAAFLSVGLYPALRSELQEWTEAVAGDPGIFKLFKAEIREVGVGFHSESMFFLGQYVNRGQYGGKHKSPFSGRVLDSRMRGRVVSLVVPETCFQGVVGYLSEQLSSFGPTSFLSVGDDVELGAGSDVLLGSSCRVGSKELREIAEAISDVLSSPSPGAVMQQYMERLEPKVKFALDPYLGFDPTESAEVHEVIVLRAALMKEVDAPWMYGHVVAQMRHMRLQEMYQPALGDVMARALENLEVYKSRMEAKYPVISRTLGLQLAK